LALALILTRAGLGMDLAALWRLRYVISRLAVLPNLAEATTIAGLSMLLLGFPPSWAFMLGFIISAISPAVVVPALLNLQDQGYGVSTGIPNMVVASAALDVVFSIAGFGICSSFAVMEDGGPLWMSIARAPLEVILGVSVGCVCAAMLVYILPVQTEAPGDGGSNGPQLRDWRAPLLLVTAVSATLALKRVGFSGASALSVLVMSAGSAWAWGTPTAREVSGPLGLFWNKVAQPLLFALVGASVNVSSVEARTLSFGFLMLVCSLAARCLMTYFAVLGRGLQRSERVFTALAWLPKATVQAALGAIALSEAHTDRQKEMGRAILTISVLAILCTAPVGAAIIGVSGPKLLVLEKTMEDDAAEIEAPADGDVKGKHEEAADQEAASTCSGDSESKRQGSSFRAEVSGPQVAQVDAVEEGQV
jgi:NhaP-type Na+/H+ or K+/H+ antiporter